VLLVGSTLAAGCSGSAVPRLGRVHPGMPLGDVFALYRKIDPLDPELSQYLPSSVPIRRHEQDDCIFETYRFWLMDEQQPASYRLEFKRCKLSEQAKQAIKDRAYKKVMKVARNPYADRSDIPRLLRFIEASTPEYSRSVLVAIEPENQENDNSKSKGAVNHEKTR